MDGLFFHAVFRRLTRLPILMMIIIRDVLVVCLIGK